MNADNADGKTVQQWEFRHLELTRRFFDVYGELGYGFLESVYRTAMTIALREEGLAVEPEVELQAKIPGPVDRHLPCRPPGRSKLSSWSSRRHAGSIRPTSLKY